MATFNDPFGPNATGWHSRASEALQPVVHVVLPAVAMVAALTFTSLGFAAAGGAAMFVIQEFGKRLPAYGDAEDDDDLFDERIPIAVGAVAAIAIVALNAPTPLILLAGYAALGALLTMWPRAFHHWRGHQSARFDSAPTYAHPDPPLDVERDREAA